MNRITLSDEEGQYINWIFANYIFTSHIHKKSLKIAKRQEHFYRVAFSANTSFLFLRINTAPMVRNVTLLSLCNIPNQPIFLKQSLSIERDEPT
jgi:hypothetical protein